jgi:hypothetical protein
MYQHLQITFEKLGCNEMEQVGGVEMALEDRGGS